MHNRVVQRALAAPAGTYPPVASRLILAHAPRRPRTHPKPAAAAFHSSPAARSTLPTEQPEDDKPRRRGPGRPTTRTSSSSAPAGSGSGAGSSAGPSQFPSSYASSHLWLPAPAPPDADAPPPGLPPPHILHDALASLLLCLHPQTQHRGLYPGPGGQPQVEPTLAMYCPIEGGEYVVDDTVREVARRAGAEVVVLDTAQLAAGVYGVFGKSAAGFQLPQNPLHVTSVTSSPSSSSQPSYSADEDDDPDGPPFPGGPATLSIQIPAAMHFSSLPLRSGRVLSSSSSTRGPQANMRKFFDEIVNLPSAPPVPASVPVPAPAPAEGEAAAPAPAPAQPAPARPRIIYVRDFTLLAPTSPHWYPALLAAVRARRSGPLARPSQPPPNPTVILFGCTPPLLPQIHVMPPSNAGGILGMLMGQGGRAGAQTLRVDGFEEDDARGREKRLKDRLAGWEKNEALWLSGELPGFGGSPPPAAAGARGGASLEPVVLLGGGLVGLPQRIGGIDPSEFIAASSAAPDDGGGGGALPEARAAPPYFRALTLLPAARDPALETETRLARRREINMLAMRMAVGAVGGVLPELGSDGGLELEEEELWAQWGRRVEPWSVVREVASRAVGGVVAEQVQVQVQVGTALSGAGVMGATLDSTPVPWTAVLDSWAAQRSAQAARKAWVESARSAVVLLPGEGEKGGDEAGSAAAERAREDEVVERVRRAEDLDESEQRLLGCIVDPASMPTGFANVHLPARTVDSIRTIVSLPLLHPQAFAQGILKQHAMTGALLFGVPGTGKTLVVRALAKESGARMLMVKPSDIMDMYVGQSEKLVRAVFTLARRLSPCIVFLDEIDALFGARVSARESGGAIAHRQVITEFMQEMDGLRTKEGGVIVIGATNRPFDLDDAVLRRLPRRLLVDLPGEREREEILKILLRDEVLAPEVDVRALARRTEGFSGSDLKHLCVSAALDAVKETVELPWAVPRDLVKDTLSLTAPSPPAIPPPQHLTPTPLEGEIAAERELPVLLSQELGSSVPIAELSPLLDGSDAPAPLPLPLTPAPVAISAAPAPTAAAAGVHTRVLRPHHFAKALTEITASTSESLGTLSDLRKWNEEFGEGGSRRGRRKRWGDRFGFGVPGRGQAGVREVGQVGNEP